jgi:hypothetical protein
MAGIQIIAKDSKGHIKQDYELSRTKEGKVVKIDELKKAEEKLAKDGKKGDK